MLFLVPIYILGSGPIFDLYWVLYFDVTWLAGPIFALNLILCVIFKTMYLEELTLTNSVWTFLNESSQKSMWKPLLKRRSQVLVSIVSSVIRNYIFFLSFFYYHYQGNSSVVQRRTGKLYDVWVKIYMIYKHRYIDNQTSKSISDKTEKYMWWFNWCQKTKRFYLSYTKRTVLC